MKHFTKFSEFIKESYDEIVNEEAGPKTDCHEIMTAYLCTLSLTEINKLISDVEKNAENIPSIITNIYNEVIKEQKKGENGKILAASNNDVQSIIIFKDRFEALLQALSAAKAIIINNSNLKINQVILTGKSWIPRVSKYAGIKNLLDNFGVNSFGMKDFNSSDIILVSAVNRKPMYVGISLKKKKINAEDPTIINRSLFDSLQQNMPSEQMDILLKTFNNFFNNIIAKNAEKLCNNNEMLQALIAHNSSKGPNKPGLIAGKYPNYLDAADFRNTTVLKEKLISICKNAPKCENPAIWKCVLSNSIGIMIPTGDYHTNKDEKRHKDVVRDIINSALKTSSSPFKKIEKLLNDNDVANGIAYALFEIIFKGQLINLKKDNFDFALCTGKGNIATEGRGKDKRKIGKVASADYEPISKITSVLNKLREDGVKNPPTLISMPVTKEEISNDNNIEYIIMEDDSDLKKSGGTISIFFKLMIGNEYLSRIRIRYKGDYTPSPQLLAEISEQFKKKLQDPVLANEPSGYSSEEEQ